MFSFKDKMTQEMLDCLLTKEAVEAEYRMCVEQYDKCKAAANTELPATSVSGEPVIHGARVQVDRVTQYWQARCNVLVEFLSQNFDFKRF